MYLCGSQYLTYYVHDKFIKFKIIGGKYCLFVCLCVCVCVCVRACVRAGVC